MTACASVETLIERRLDGTATATDNARLDAHLAVCPDCAALVAAETAIDAALAARLGGAEPSAALGAAIRRRIRDERRPVGGWIADALNGLGALLVLVAVAPIASGWGGSAGVALATAALVVSVYPLLLAAWVADDGAEPDPVP